jgi:formate dehydrogenase iron-sulfur subunit
MSQSQPIDPSKKMGILNDVTLCIGCERCVEACVQQNKLPRDFLAHFTAKDGLSGHRLTSIVRTEGKNDDWRLVRRQCLHCLEPSCMSACLVGAFSVNADGAVEYDADKCIGCRYCMLACPFSIPRYEYNRPLPYIRKCKMNDECRVDGDIPACVAACPTRATVFGPREDILLEAQFRIRGNPEHYIDHIWGEHEFGGTSVLYISDVPLDDVLKMPSREQLEHLRLPALAEKSVPALVKPWVMVAPVQLFAVSLGLAGIWAVRRRNLMARKKQAETPTGRPAEAEPTPKEDDDGR